MESLTKVERSVSLITLETFTLKLRLESHNHRIVGR